MIETLKREYYEATDEIQYAQELRFNAANKRGLAVLRMYEAGYSLVQLSRILGFDESRVRTLIKRGRKYQLDQANKTQKDE